MDDDTEGDISLTDDLIGTFIPNGPTNHRGYIIPFPISHIISPVYVYSFTDNDNSVINHSQSRMMMIQKMIYQQQMI